MPRPPMSIRSPLMLLLLLILRESPAPSHYIAYYLNEDPRKVSTYLSRLRRYGLVGRDSYGIWYLTDRGRRFIAMLEEAVANSAVAVHNAVQRLSNLLERQQKSTKIQQKSTETQHLSALETVLEKAKQLLGRSLSDTERALITYLYDFSTKTGRKYWWPPEPVPLPLALAEELERSSGISVSPSNIEQALRELEARGVVFIAFDGRRGVAKIRLSKRLVEENT